MMTTIGLTLRQILADTLGVEAARLEPASPLLGAVPALDSLGQLALLQALEDRFGLLIEPGEMPAGSLATLGSLENYLCARLCGWGGA